MVPWATQLPRGHIHKAGAKPKSHSMPDREETLNTCYPFPFFPLPLKAPGARLSRASRCLYNTSQGCLRRQPPW